MINYIFDNTTRNRSFRKKIHLSDSKFEFARRGGRGECLIGVGWVMSSLLKT